MRSLVLRKEGKCALVECMRVQDTNLVYPLIVFCSIVVEHIGVMGIKGICTLCIVLESYSSDNKHMKPTDLSHLVIMSSLVT